MKRLLIVLSCLIFISANVYAKSSGGYSGGSKSSFSSGSSGYSGGSKSSFSSGSSGYSGGSKSSFSSGSSGYSGGSKSSFSSGSSGYSGGSKSSFSSGSSGYSGGSKNDTITPKAPEVKRDTFSGYSGGSKESMSKTTPPSETKAPEVKRDAAAIAKTRAISQEQSKAAMTEYKAKQAQFKEPIKAIPADVKAPKVEPRSYSNTGYTYTPETRVIRVNHYYGGWNPPVYVYHSSPSYGIWNTLFLYHMLNSGNHSFFYNHGNDPYVQQFLTQARQNSEQDANLQNQINSLQKQVQDLKEKNTPINENYIPEDADPDIAYADNYVEQNSDKLYKKDISKETKPVETPNETNWGKILAWIFGTGIVAGGVYYFMFVRKYE